MERIVSPPKEPKEGDLFRDALTDKIMFYRFGQWQEITEEEAKIVESLRKVSEK